MRKIYINNKINNGLLNKLRKFNINNPGTNNCPGFIFMADNLLNHKLYNYCLNDFFIRRSIFTNIHSRSITNKFSRPFSTLKNNKNNFEPIYNLIKNAFLNDMQLVTIKGDILLVTFRFVMFNAADLFVEKIKDSLEANTDYLILIKIRYGAIPMYKMAGKQINFSFTEQNKIEKLHDLYRTVRFRVLDTLSKYEIDDHSVFWIQLVIRKYNVRVLTDIKYKDITVTETKPFALKQRDFSLFPLTVDPDLLGSKVFVDVVDDNEVYITHADTTSISPHAKINCSADSIVRNDLTDFYLREVTKLPYILAVLETGNVIYREAYDLSGEFIASVTDRITNDGIFRTANNTITKFNKQNEVVSISRDMEVSPIKLDSSKTQAKGKINLMQNLKIGVIDLEVYYNSSLDRSFVYSGGIYTYIDKDPKLFYINNKLDSQQLVLDMIKEMFLSKYRGITFYCHNFGKYDIYYILKTLIDYNDSLKNNNTQTEGITGYDIDCIFRDGVVLKLKISKKRSNKKDRLESITISDSYPILTNSLKDLCRIFNISDDKTKGFFPHNFANENTLFYKGPTPDIKYYITNNHNISIEEYNNKYLKNDWDFKLESNRYLKNDLLSLYEVISKANQELYLNFDVSFTDALTISGIALKIFMKNYYKEPVIPLINKNQISLDIRQSYYGGITEVYIPKGKNLNYYDVNSLYPFVALNDMPGITCTYKQFYNKSDYSLNQLFGFYYCKVSINPDQKNYLGLLPVRIKDKGLVFPVGEWEGWYFSEELKFAQENGYNIEVLKGYTFERQKNVFNSYVHDLFGYRSNSDNPALKSVAKMLLNSLLGRFGLQLDKQSTNLVDEETFQFIAATRKISSVIEFNKDNILISFDKDLDMDLIDSFNLDIDKVIQKSNKLKETKLSEDSYNNVSVAISSAVTAYARIHISQIKLDILKLGGRIFYSDTDSIVTDLVLDSSYLDNKQLGKLKVEHSQIKIAYFITNKTYCLLTNDNKLIKKAKGFDSKNLTLSDYINLYNGMTVEGVRTESNKNYLEGYVNIKENKLELSPLSYQKREKLYDNKNLWVNTRPLVLYKDTIIPWNSNSMVIYNPNEIKLSIIKYITNTKELINNSIIPLTTNFMVIYKEIKLSIVKYNIYNKKFNKHIIVYSSNPFSSAIIVYNSKDLNNSVIVYNSKHLNISIIYNSNTFNERSQVYENKLIVLDKLRFKLNFLSLWFSFSQINGTLGLYLYISYLTIILLFIMCKDLNLLFNNILIVSDQFGSTQESEDVYNYSLNTNKVNELHLKALYLDEDDDFLFERMDDKISKISNKELRNFQRSMIPSGDRSLLNKFLDLFDLIDYPNFARSAKLYNSNILISNKIVLNSQDTYISTKDMGILEYCMKFNIFPTNEDSLRKLLICKYLSINPITNIENSVFESSNQSHNEEIIQNNQILSSNLNSSTLIDENNVNNDLLMEQIRIQNNILINYKSVLHNSEINVEDAYKQIDGNNKTIDTIINDFNKQTTNLLNLENKLIEAEDNINALNSELSVQQDLNLKIRVEALERLDQANLKNEELENVITDLNNKYNLNIQELEILRENQDNELSNYKNLVESLDSSINRKDDLIQQIRDELNNYIESEYLLKNELKLSNSKIDTLNTKIEEDQQSFNELRSRLDVLHSDLAEAMNQNHELNILLENTNISNETSTRDLITQNQNHIENVNILSRNITNIQNELTKVTLERDRYINDILTLTDITDELNQEVQELNTRINNLLNRMNDNI